jgi:hypothetical protein
MLRRIADRFPGMRRVSQRAFGASPMSRQTPRGEASWFWRANASPAAAWRRTATSRLCSSGRNAGLNVDIGDPNPTGIVSVDDGQQLVEGVFHGSIMG